MDLDIVHFSQFVTWYFKKFRWIFEFLPLLPKLISPPPKKKACWGGGKISFFWGGENSKSKFWHASRAGLLHHPPKENPVAASVWIFYHMHALYNVHEMHMYIL